MNYPAFHAYRGLKYAAESEGATVGVDGRLARRLLTLPARIENASVNKTVAQAEAGAASAP